ncbi:class I SAM-dependent methyltransferase [Fictibacillus aquaticus]|uniref:SAM-dependent methyltransferase n=1 Tax=Fictibacillus aquaticus TaxID=2021314 RepID=A0A235FAA6_9BACL|nr:class I SAM-dependent methyltransferase [Fictibacillus aquaticus]OYD58202.1 SAM-dependent methyltransferase [Fictibacillus aquaticus]
MSSFEKMEKLFTVLDVTASAIKEEDSTPYLTALAESGENLFYGEVPQDYSAKLKDLLQQEYKKVSISALENEEIRKAFQLAVLKGMKEAIQPNHAMTPDAVALFMGYLIRKMKEHETNVTLLDPVIGSGNMLTAVMNLLEGKELSAFGVEIDETLLRLSWSSANLQKHAVELFHQDTIKPLYIEPVDIALADLPVGFYPDDETAKDFVVHHEKGHTYAHHLIMEQAMKYVKDSGFGVFLVPNRLFESEQADLLQKWIKNHAAVLGLIELPMSLFKSETHAKSILILQKNGTEMIKPKQAMLVKLPPFSNKDALNKVMKQMDEWFKTEWKREK